MNVKTFRVVNSSIVNYCYLLYCNQQGVLIDPAWDYCQIDEFMRDNKIFLKGVLLTHSHFDHTNLAEKFSKQHNVPVFMSRIEISHSGFECLNLRAVTHLENISMASFGIIPILTPGHTSGSMCYLAGKHLFAGDTVFIEGVGICSEKRSDAGQLFDSVQLIKETVSNDTKFWPGHSFGEPPGKDLNYLMQNNIYFQLDNREHFVKFRMRKNTPDPFSFY